MGRHSGSKKRQKRKGIKRTQQMFALDGGAIIVNGRKFYSHQMHEAGHAFEDLCEEALMMMQSNGSISGFVKHPINSQEDKEGKDFTIWFGDVENPNCISFGVSISSRKVHLARTKHPGVTQILMRHSWNKRQIAHEILKAFELSKAA